MAKQKMTSILLLVLLLVQISLPVFASEAAVQIIVDGKRIQTDVAPVIENGRVLAPLRAVFEALGATVNYTAETRTILAVKGFDRITLQIGSAQALVNGSAVKLDVPAKIISGRTMVPLRFVGEALGAEVSWDGINRIVTVKSPAAVSEKPVETNTGDGITKTFVWDYGGVTNTLDMTIHRADYNYFKSLKRPYTNDYSVYVTNTNDDAYIADLVKTFRAEKEKRGLSERQTVDFVVAFVQNLKYMSDLATTGFDEYPKYPLETLVEDGGDCEDTSILLTSILKEMGYGVILLEYPNVHMAVGVKGSADIPGDYYYFQGERYYYVETTAPNWKIGEMPDEYKGLQVVFSTIIPKPIITFSWTSIGADLKVTVSNDGTASAENLFVYSAFDAGGGMVWNPMESGRYTLAPGQSIVIPVALKVPTNVYTRLLVKIVSNGEVLSDGASDWFNTY